MSEARARASEAAVGAKSPDDGSLGLGDVAAEGVLGREAEGVFGLEGVIDAREDGLDFDGMALIAPGALAVEADVDSPGWKDEGGDFAGVRMRGFAGATLDLLSRVFEGVAGVRAVVVEGRAEVGLCAAAVFLGGEDGGVGLTTLSEIPGETGTGSAGFSSATGSTSVSDMGSGSSTLR